MSVDPPQQYNRYIASHIHDFYSITDWRRRNWGNIRVTERVLKKCIRLLRNNNMVACCDGSVNFNRSVHAWGLACKRKKQLFVTGCAPVDGHPSTLNSTRAEILGIMTCVSFLQWISLRENISGKTITIYIDSESAIQCSTLIGLSSTKYALHNDIEVILELQSIIKSSGNKISLVHVEGHQDQKIPFDELDPKAKLNVLMDKAVGLFIEQNPRGYQHSIDASHFPAQLVCLSGPYGTITGNFKDVFIDNFNEPVRREYMKKHFGTPSSTGANWKHVARVLRTDKGNRSKNVKLLHNQYNTFVTCNR